MISACRALRTKRPSLWRVSSFALFVCFFLQSFSEHGTASAALFIGKPAHRNFYRMRPTLVARTKKEPNRVVEQCRTEKYFGGSNINGKEGLGARYNYQSALMASTPNGSFDDFTSVPETPFKEKQYILALACSIGVLAGLNISAFKLTIEFVRDFCYGSGSISEHLPILLIPLLGGIIVSALLFSVGGFAPGLLGTIDEIDQASMIACGVDPIEEVCDDDDNDDDENQGLKDVWKVLVSNAPKAIAATATLGTGNSLGPEGPAVEAGMAMSRLCTAVPPPAFLFGSKQQNVATVIDRNRLLLKCGAAAGVASGFNAPLSGVFFCARDCAECIVTH